MTEPEDYEIQSLETYYALDNATAFMSEVRKIQKQKTLHVGCGRGTILTLDPEWQGVDFNPKLKQLWEKSGIKAQIADVRDLDSLFDVFSFDYTFSVDFLEHIQVLDLQDVADQLRRVGVHGVHIIDSVESSRFRGVDDKNLHPAAMVKDDEWISIFGDDATIRQISGRHRVLEW